MVHAGRTQPPSPVRWLRPGGPVLAGPWSSSTAVSAPPRARYTLRDLRGRRTLMVASTGGHLTQLTRLAPRLGVDPDSPWLTFDAPQSRSLLKGKHVQYVPYVSPRDIRGVLNAARLAQALIDESEAAVSTGAGLAAAVLPQMALQRQCPSVYIESISRVSGPSVTGRWMSLLPTIGLYAQHAQWSRPPWRHELSVLSDYMVVPSESRSPASLFVTLGTIAPYRFDRLIDLVLGFLREHPDCEVTWQVGATDRSDLPGKVVKQLSEAEFAATLERSDLVIAHSGVGVAMNILDKGHIPILGARRAGLDEHVDDHQQQILTYLVDRGLGLDATAALTRPDVLDYALTHRVTTPR